jgi:hypothetical protein
LQPVKLKLCLCAVLVGLAGCSSDERRESGSKAPPQPTAEPVAYALDRATLRELEHDYGRIVTDGQEVASSEWDAYTGVVAAMFLEGKGIRLLDAPPRLARIAQRISKAQQVELTLLDDTLRRRYAAKLAALKPDEDELARFYEEFSEEAVPDVGRGMLDWVRVYRESLARARGETVVAIPVED